MVISLKVFSFLSFFIMQSISLPALPSSSCSFPNSHLDDFRGVYLSKVAAKVLETALLDENVQVPEVSEQRTTIAH